MSHWKVRLFYESLAFFFDPARGPKHFINLQREYSVVSLRITLDYINFSFVRNPLVSKSIPLLILQPLYLFRGRPCCLSHKNPPEIPSVSSLSLAGLLKKKISIYMALTCHFRVVLCLYFKRRVFVIIFHVKMSAICMIMHDNW